jgi:hypothetical protein
MFYLDVCPACAQRAQDKARQSNSSEPGDYETGEGMSIENEPEPEMDRLADPAQIKRMEVPVTSSKTSSALHTFLMSPQTMDMTGGH